MFSFELHPELRAGLEAIKERDGAPVAEQIRRAIQMWLDAKGINLTRPARKGAAAKRKRQT